jgi:predicted RNA-binding protein with TRAM domain
MHIPDALRCLFSGRVEERDGRYVVEIPERELRQGDLEGGETYRVALLSGAGTAETAAEASSAVAGSAGRAREEPTPPVDEGEERTVEIEDTGDQGDGLTRVERGFVVIVPDAEVGERVRIGITDVQENVAFADVVERLSYYE